MQQENKGPGGSGHQMLNLATLGLWESWNSLVSGEQQ